MHSHPIKLLLASIAASAVLLVPAQAGAAKPAPPSVPASIQVPAGHKLFLVGHAVGVQIYRCDAVAGGHEWRLVAPRADLYGDNGKVIVKHFGGPSWQAKDGSLAVGTRVGDPYPVAGTIPWILLSTVSTPGADGDRLAGTKYIQRLATTGGVAPPAADCTAATAGTVKEIPYTADYYFWKAKG